MGAQIQAKTSAVSYTDINKARPFNCKKTSVEEAGQAADPDPDCADPDPAEPPPKKGTV